GLIRSARFPSGSRKEMLFAPPDQLTTLSTGTRLPHPATDLVNSTCPTGEGHAAAAGKKPTRRQGLLLGRLRLGRRARPETLPRLGRTRPGGPRIRGDTHSPRRGPAGSRRLRVGRGRRPVGDCLRAGRWGVYARVHPGEAVGAVRRDPAVRRVARPDPPLQGPRRASV